MNTPNSNDSRPSTSRKELAAKLAEKRLLEIEVSLFAKAGDWDKKNWGHASPASQFLRQTANDIHAVTNMVAALEAPAQEIVGELREKVEADIKESEAIIDELQYASPMNHDITIFNRGRIKQAEAVLTILSQSAASKQESKS